MHAVHFSQLLSEFGHWLDTVDRHVRGSKMFGHWFDTVDRQRRSIDTFLAALEMQILFTKLISMDLRLT